MRSVDIGHCDRLAERGREAAAGHIANLAVANKDFGTFACGHTAIELEADPFALRAFGDFAIDPLGSGKAAFSPAALVDAKDQPRLDWRSVWRKVMPVER